MIPRLHIDGSELLAVPAVHNRCVFAELVNRTCRDEATRPDAIVVELSHDTVTAIVEWFRELGVGAAGGCPIPCMLGLIKRNRRIHPRLRAASLRLQKTHGKMLHEIGPEILHRELGFTPVSSICLSNTDSMIEAVRLALELDIPVYGIDIGEVAAAERGHPLIEDPLGIGDDLAAFLERHGPTCTKQRDPVIDDRREFAMAARLKRVLQEYRRVLFTGGLGHWSELERRLKDPSLQPAKEISVSEGEELIRVLVSPSIAVSHMDLFPEVGGLYEAARQLHPHDSGRRIDLSKLVQTKLSTIVELASASERDAVVGLMRYLDSLSIVQLRRLPDWRMVLHAAGVMVTPEFAARVSGPLIVDPVKWEIPSDWPQLPVLGGVRSSDEQADRNHRAPRARLECGGKSSDPFYLGDFGSRNGDSGSWRLPPLTDDEKEEKSKSASSPYYSWVWPPCESLLFGTAYEGAEEAWRMKSERQSEVFGGSLHQGIDVKSTLRGLARGEHRVHVKVNAASSTSRGTSRSADEPSVFIFDREEAASDGYLETFQACYASDVPRLARDKKRVEEVFRTKGHKFIASVAMLVRQRPPAHLAPHVSDLCYLYGIVTFGGPCMNPRESVRWLESTNYSRCPVLNHWGTGGLFNHYRKEHNLAIDPKRWTSALISLALPYASRRVTVIAPQSMVIPPAIRAEAAMRRVQLDEVPLSHFSKERIEAIRRQYLVQPADADALTFSPEVQAAFGQSPTAHSEMLPSTVRERITRDYAR